MRQILQIYLTFKFQQIKMVRFLIRIPKNQPKSCFFLCLNSSDLKKNFWDVKTRQFKNVENNLKNLNIVKYWLNCTLFTTAINRKLRTPHKYCWFWLYTRVSDSRAIQVINLTQLTQLLVSSTLQMKRYYKCKFSYYIR